MTPHPWGPGYSAQEHRMLALYHAPSCLITGERRSCHLLCKQIVLTFLATGSAPRGRWLPQGRSSGQGRPGCHAGWSDLSLPLGP